MTSVPSPRAEWRGWLRPLKWVAVCVLAVWLLQLLIEWVRRLFA